jgi:hypothetical protein
MAHFDDLSEYQYSGAPVAGVLHVGWLGRGHSFTRGVVSQEIVAKLKRLAARPVELYRGTHVCELCDVPESIRSGQDRFTRYSAWAEWARERESNGEIRVSKDGVIYAAPVLITHYIEEHGYCPPTDFLKAVEEHQEP